MAKTATLTPRSPHDRRPIFVVENTGEDVRNPETLEVLFPNGVFLPIAQWARMCAFYGCDTLPSCRFYFVDNAGNEVSMPYGTGLRP